MSTTPHILFFGFGFSASTLAPRLAAQGFKVTGTSRSDAGVQAIARAGFEGLLYDGLQGIANSVTHIVSSVPPDAGGDPVVQRFGQALSRKASNLAWVAYLSTTGVYGDHAGGWVDEDTALTPNTERGQRRLLAEQQWLDLHRSEGLPLHIFRLAGIYGPGRNVLDNLRDGTAKRVIREGQVFSRIHVADIAGVLQASMARPHPGRAYNVADDHPSPPQDVVTYGAGLLGLAPPPEVPFAQADLSPMARSFYADSKRVSNRLIKTELGYRFAYPDYKTGLRSLV